VSTVVDLTAPGAAEFLAELILEIGNLVFNTRGRKDFRWALAKEFAGQLVLMKGRKARRLEFLATGEIAVVDERTGKRRLHGPGSPLHTLITTTKFRGHRAAVEQHVADPSYVAFKQAAASAPPPLPGRLPRPRKVTREMH